MAAAKSSGSAGGTPEQKTLDLAESVAGEEDPGASIDLAAASMPGRSDHPTTLGDQPSGDQAPMSPGDEAPAGTPGTGETVCPRCGGSGKLGASDCAQCQGTGKVNVGIGGA